MASMPYLTNIEKKWIAFQIIYGLSQIHNKGLCHGDIKLENILLSSIGSVFISDMAPYKPAYLQYDDVGSYTYFFGKNYAMKSCYFAPERLVDKYELLELQNLSKIYNLTTAMDIFSAGAVIAELFLEDMLFDHPKLLDYKKGKFKIADFFSKKIKDKKLEGLLLKMLKVKPAERIDLSECLKIFCDDILPISFSKMLIHINSLVVSSVYWKPDRRIGLIYKHWKQIWKVLYGLEGEVPELQQILNRKLLNDILMDSPFSQYLSESFPIIFDGCDNLIIDESFDFQKNNNSDSAIIVVNLILSSISIAKYPSSKIVGMEIVRIFSSKLSDLTKIQVILPYFVKMLKDPSNLVRITALQEIITILNSVNEIELLLPSSDYNFFDAYVFPSIIELYTSNEPSLILAFANNIDKFTDLELKYLQITLRSRFHNSKNQNTEVVVKNDFNFNKSQNKERGEEIILAYDTDLYEFKTVLFKIIEDILSKNDDINVQITLIRKLPNLILFYGRRETNSFTKFIIANFNKKNWIIQREILKSIPSLIITIGETAFNHFIVPCMESIINNNLNELKIYEMIHTMHILLKMEFLENIRAVELFKKILPFIMHPNLQIRNEVINFSITLIETLNQGEVYTYLRQDFKNYLFMPFIILNRELITNVTRDRLSRVIYELEKREIKYFFQRTNEDEVAFSLLDNTIKIGVVLSKYNEEQADPLENQLVRMRMSLDGLLAINKVKKEFNKFLKKYSQEDSKFLETTFLGKLISFSTISQVNNVPKRISGNVSNLSNDNHSITENFKLKFIFKTLDIAVKPEVLEEIEAEVGVNYKDNIFNSKENNKEVSTNNKYSNNINNTKLGASHSLVNWKPQGKLICTLFDHEQSDSSGSTLTAPVSVEKLLKLSDNNNSNLSNGNKFLSFGSDGQIILWDIASNESDISVEKSASTRNIKMGISYNKAICNVDYNQFAVASNNTLEVYRVNFFNFR
jgi:serine/threonine protein kinase